MFEKITPEAAGVPSSEISRFIDYLNSNSLCTHALLMMKGDKIFTEAYWKPFNKDYRHRQYSQTKSFVGIAIGLLVSDGKLSLTDKIVDLFPEKIDRIDLVPDRLSTQTVGDMLTMTTVGEERVWFTANDPDRTHLYFEARENAKIPGTLWKYDSSGSQVLSSLVEKLAGKPLLEFLHERIFSHMGTFQTAKILKTPNGDSWGDSALLCTARDMASFAKLLMDRGKWEGKQLICEEYVRKATSSVVDNSEERFASVFGHGYGYQIWRAPRDGFAFVGMGAQLTVVLPSKQLIFVINSDTQGNASAYDLIVNGFLSFVADRMSDKPLDEHNGAYSALEEQIAKLELFSLKGKEDFVLKQEINNVPFLCEPNRLGMSQFSFHFNEDSGEFRYTNKQGDKIIPFGINKNVFGKFPQLGYSNEIGGETTNGFMYDDAVSLRFTQDNKLQLRVQIIDQYFGNFLATFAFKNEEVACKFTAAAEHFLTEYNGQFTAHKKHANHDENAKNYVQFS